MEQKKKLIIALSVVFSTSVFAQENQTLNIPQTKPGQCQALVISPAAFKEDKKTIVVKEATTIKEIIPAQYEEVDREVVIKPERQVTKVIPATYKTVEETIEATQDEPTQEVIPPKWATIIEEEEIKPTYLDAKRASSRDEALRLVEVPAERHSFKKQVVQEKSVVRTKKETANSIIIKKQVIDQPERLEKVTIPAETKIVKIRKLVTPAQVKDKQIPAEKKEIKIYRKIKDAEISWKPVLCATSLSADTIELLQSKLNRLGYDVGEPDGKLGPKTYKAIEEYQKAKKLDRGGLTFEVMESLNIPTN